MPSWKTKIRKGVQDFLRDDSAATAIEYGMITVVMCTVVAASMGRMQESDLWNVLTELNEQFRAFTNQ